MNRFLSTAAFLLLSAPAFVAGGEDFVSWEIAWDGDGEVRTGVFEVADAACAYRFMADTSVLLRTLEHLEQVDIHKDRGDWQDATYHERFFLVGLVESRYHRTLNSRDAISWELVDGRQKRHDGTWKVTPTAHGAEVRFENVIEAKSRLHNGLLRRIQTRTMADISAAALKYCGPPS